MRRKPLLIVMTVILAFSMLLAACGGNDKANEPANTGNTNNSSNSNTPPADQPADEPIVEPVKDLSGTLELWQFDPGFFVEQKAAFEAKYPKVTVNLTSMDWGEMHDQLFATIAAGTGGPDLAFIEGGKWKMFNNTDGLEDLLQQPYDVGQFRDEFTDANWNRWVSVDGKKMLGMPWDTPPAMTFYRADILEENGFPSDPAELMAYMADADNVLNMIRTLKAKGIYLFEWRDSVIGLMNSGISFFDKDLNYRRNTDNFVKSFDIAKTITQEELYIGQGIWGEEGQQSIKNGKLISIFLGSWGISQTRNWGGPEQEGKWRVTGLPFGAYGGSGGSTVSILSQSKNKELAWEFIKFALASEEGQKIFTEKGIMPGWKPAWDLPEFKDKKEPYLGGENINLVAATLLDKVPPSFETPLDDKANEIWSAGINELLDKNLDSKAQLQKIEDDIMAAVSVERQKLLDARK